jgi:DNA-binding response OmpR family regulator
MITLIVTDNDSLFDRLACYAPDNDSEYLRAGNVLEGLRLARMRSLDAIVVDLSLHAADTLVETLRSRSTTADTPLYAVHSGKPLPLSLRRLCTDVLEVDKL